MQTRQIEDEDWQRVVAAFRRGLAEKHHPDAWTKMWGSRQRDNQLVRELVRVKKALDQCSPRTLKLLDKVITTMGLLPWTDPARGLVACHVDELIDLAWHPEPEVKPKPGPDARLSCRYAAKLLRELYPGDHEKVRGAKANLTKKRDGNYAFNPYITWLGEQLCRAEDEALPKDARRMSQNEACLAAWNATPTRSHQPSGIANSSQSTKRTRA